MEFTKIRLACKKLGVRYDNKCMSVIRYIKKIGNSLFAIFALRYHNKNETAMHWRVKSALFFELVHNRGKTVFSEFPLDGNVADLFVLDDNMVLEVQTSMTPQLLREKILQFPKRNVWIVPVKDFERDFDHVLKYWVEKMGV